MLEVLKVILLGIVEGITEWLPISSTGHMILLDQFIHLNVSDAFKEMFLVVIQFGAILAVVVMFWNRLWPFHRRDPEKTGIEAVGDRKKLNMHCKGLLFRQCTVGIVNADDRHLEQVLEGHTCSIETFGIDSPQASLRAVNIRHIHQPGYLGVEFDLAGEMNFHGCREDQGPLPPDHLHPQQG